MMIVVQTLPSICCCTISVYLMMLDFFFPLSLYFDVLFEVTLSGVLADLNEAAVKKDLIIIFKLS